MREDKQNTTDRKISSIFETEQEVMHGRGYIYCLQYHIVWVTKYRKPVLRDGIDDEVKGYLTASMDSLGMECIAMEVMPDHVHLLVSARPQLRLSDAVKVLKGNTARWLFMAHPELKRRLWKGHMWNPSYFVATVSERSLSHVEEYIKNQKAETPTEKGE